MQNTTEASVREQGLRCTISGVLIVVWLSSHHWTKIAGNEAKKYFIHVLRMDHSKNINAPEDASSSVAT